MEVVVLLLLSCRMQHMNSYESLAVAEDGAAYAIFSAKSPEQCFPVYTMNFLLFYDSFNLFLQMLGGRDRLYKGCITAACLRCRSVSKVT